MKTFTARLAIKIAEKGKQIRDYQIEMEFVYPVYFTLIASFFAAVSLTWLLCWMIGPYGFNSKPLP